MDKHCSLRGSLLAEVIERFGRGEISSGHAARLLGISRVEYLVLIGQYGVSPFQMTEEELRRDVLNA
jgi:predicted HTH domain antitoxin